MGVLVLLLTVVGAIALGTFVVVSPTVPHWVKLLFNILVGVAVFAGICFLIFVIMGILAHI